jgi:hypothetical protein
VPLSAHFGFAAFVFGMPDVCSADEPELDACEEVWVRSCCESKKDSDRTTISFLKGMNLSSGA